MSKTGFHAIAKAEYELRQDTESRSPRKVAEEDRRNCEARRARENLEEDMALEREFNSFY